jgi:hypothetical protein
MDDSSVHVKSEDTSRSVDLPPLEDEADSADDVDFDEAIIPTIVNKKSAEILIEIDEDRKKVIRLNDGGYDSLVELFFEAVADDPGLKEYANSTFVFQIFNQKFNTWVDLDRSTELIDGSHLKAIFLTQTEHTESRHKHRKSSKRRLADSSDKCSDDNCKSKIFCSSEDSIRAKRICQPIKASETDVEKNSVTTSLSVRNHDLVDFVNNSSKKQVSESHSVSPVSQGLCNQILISTKSCKNCSITSVETLPINCLEMHVLLPCVLNKCFCTDYILVGCEASYPKRTVFRAMLLQNPQNSRVFL